MGLCLQKFYRCTRALIGARWLTVYVRKEKLFSLLFLLPYAFVSGINLTNARQGFFLYPYYVFNYVSMGIHRPIRIREKVH